MQFKTASDLARMAGRSVDVVRYDMRIGKLSPDGRTENGHALFSQETAERWAAERNLKAGQHGAAA